MTTQTDAYTSKLNAKSTAGHAATAYLSEQAARLRTLEADVRRGEPDAIHQMRVTARRARATLAAFPAVWPSPVTARLRGELKWLGRALGGARDTEVLSARLHDDLDDLPAELVLGPAKARVTVHFAPRDADAREAVIQALDSPRFAGLLDELGQLLAAPPQTPRALAPARDVLPEAVARAYRRTARRMRRARRATAGPARDAALHEARKAAKRARYAAEAAVPVCGKKAKRFTKRIKALQSSLGDHHDAVTARTEARDLGIAAHLAGENAFSFGLLHERARRDALDREDQARHAWKRAKRRKSTAWLPR
jgi:CHAD domain-containing protein